MSNYDTIIDGLGEVLRSEHERKVAPFVRKLEKAIDSEDIDDIRDVISTFDLTAAYRARKAEVRHYNHLAFLFGVNRINPSDTAKSTQIGRPLNIIGTSTDQCEVMLAGGSNTIKAELTAELNLMVDKLNDLEHSGQKKERTSKADDPKQRILLQFKERLVKTSKEGAGNLVSLVASLNMARMSSYGFMNEATLVGITHYKYNALDDSRTTDICNHLDGKVFPVDTAFTRLAQELRINDSDELKAFAPFPIVNTPEALGEFTSLSSDELQARGFSYPPMHFNCRSTVDYVKGTIQVAGLEIPTAATGLSEILSTAEIRTLLQTVGLSAGTIDLAKGALLAGASAIDVITDLAISYEALALIQALIDYDI
ncbi:nuclease domain protein [Vibrio phage LV6]|nr:nuclease domain protein [Vibrio phage LV6]